MGARGARRAEPGRVAEELHQVLLAQAGVQRTKEQDITLVYFVAKLFEGARLHKADDAVQWALRALRQWPGPDAQKKFLSFSNQLLDPKDWLQSSKLATVLEEAGFFNSKNLSVAWVFDKDLALLEKLPSAEHSLRTRVLLQLAGHQVHAGPLVRRNGQWEPNGAAAGVPSHLFH